MQAVLERGRDWGKVTLLSRSESPQRLTAEALPAPEEMDSDHCTPLGDSALPLSPGVPPPVPAGCFLHFVLSSGTRGGLAWQIIPADCPPHLSSFLAVILFTTDSLAARSGHASPFSPTRPKWKSAGNSWEMLLSSYCCCPFLLLLVDFFFFFLF